MGDGGLIFQITDAATGRLVAVSDHRLRCLVTHKAPLNPECAKSRNPAQDCKARILPEPAGWKALNFDTSKWEAAKLYTEDEVGPKGGYDEIRWDRSAKLVWTSDLVADNTLLCKLRIDKR